MKYYFGSGVYLEPDEEPRESPFHRRIVRTTAIPNTRAGNWLDLDCGHRVMSFGNLDHAAGRIRCTECRDQAESKG